MPINHVDGRFGLDCYYAEPIDDHAKPIDTEYAEGRDELEARARILIAAGRFKYLELQRWDADAYDWEVVQTYATE